MKSLRAKLTFLIVKGRELRDEITYFAMKQILIVYMLNSIVVAVFSYKFDQI